MSNILLYKSYLQVQLTLKEVLHSFTWRQEDYIAYCIRLMDLLAVIILKLKIPKLPDMHDTMQVEAFQNAILSEALKIHHWKQRGGICYMDNSTNGRYDWQADSNLCGDTKNLIESMILEFLDNIEDPGGRTYWYEYSIYENRKLYDQYSKLRADERKAIGSFFIRLAEMQRGLEMCRVQVKEDRIQICTVSPYGLDIWDELGINTRTILPLVLLLEMMETKLKN